MLTKNKYRLLIYKMCTVEMVLGLTKILQLYGLGGHCGNYASPYTDYAKLTEIYSH